MEIELDHRAQAEIQFLNVDETDSEFDDED